MKVDLFETHDRLLHLQKDQWEQLSQGAEECLKSNPMSIAIQMKCPYVYLFAHPRAVDWQEKLDYLAGVRMTPPSTRFLWQPRISRPRPQENSYCFRAISKSDIIEVCWLLPASELWDQYYEGKVTEHDLTSWSIHKFKNNFKELDQPHPDDLPEERQRNILIDVLYSQGKFKPILNLPEKAK